MLVIQVENAGDKMMKCRNSPFSLPNFQASLSDRPKCFYPSQISKIHSNPFELKNPKFKNPFDANPTWSLHSVNDRGFLVATQSPAWSLFSVNDKAFLAANRSPACSFLSVNNRGFLVADRSLTCSLLFVNDKGFLVADRNPTCSLLSVNDRGFQCLVVSLGVANRESQA
ncbi:hypothetical protein SLEP1_g39580 [Rubroshorea leprosula]|uniref:Uncharacterized protein n=1 Tax=Rubroshorea leprosula TaxID=152421 RepID=A0AAV5L0P2_9ROSI|nr:hypothetical protein SLEP1_g39580 [Rubroshorea leprosula]